MEASKGFHDRGCVWDLVAYHWADGKNWIERRKIEAIERRNFVTYALTYTKSATTGISPIGYPMKVVVLEKMGRRVDQVVMTVSTRDDGTNVEMRVDRQIAEKWINGYYIMAKRYNEKMEKIQVMLHSWWKRRLALPIANMEIFVKQTCLQRTQICGHTDERRSKKKAKHMGHTTL